MIEKAVDTKVKAGFQPTSGTRKINFRCLKRYKPLVKKDKDDIYWEQCNEATNKDKKKAKSHNAFFSTNQPQTQASSSKKCQEKR